jgi:hypothetical protein
MDQSLLEYFVDQFTDFGKAPPRFEKRLVILPTARAATWLKARLMNYYEGAALGEFLTLDSFLSMCSSTSGKLAELSVASENMEDMVFQEILGQAEFPYFTEDHAQELLVLHRELWEANIPQNEIKNRINSQIDLFFRSEQAADLIKERLLHSIDALHQHSLRLNKWGLVSGGEYAATEIQQLCETKKILAPKYKFIDLVGLTSVTPIWQKLLDHLASDQRVQFWFAPTGTPAEPRKSDHGHTLSIRSPMNQMISQLSQAGARMTLYRNKEFLGQHFYRSYNSIETEIRQTIASIAQLHQNGAPLHEIALLTGDDSYGPAIMAALQNHDELEANIGLPIHFSETLWGRLLSDVFELIADDQNYQRWCYLIHVIDPQAGPGEVSKWLETLRERSLSPHSRQGLQLAPPRHQKIVSVLGELIEQFLCCDIDATKILLESLLSELQVNSKKSNINPTTELYSSERAWQEFQSKWEHLQKQIRNLYETIPGPKYFAYLSKHLLRAPLRNIGEPLSGLQVLSLAEARNYPFHMAFIVGVGSRQYPQGAPRDDLWDDAYKRALGLPGWIYRHRTEEQNLESLLARVPTVVFSYPETIKNEVQEPSPMLINGIFSKTINRLEPDEPPKLDKHLKELPLPESPELERAPPPRLAPATLDLGQYLKKVSATSLTNFLSCPYKFAFDRMRVSPVRLSSPSSDPLLKGNWLHRVLEKFYDRTHPIDPSGSWPDQNLTHQEFAELGKYRLNLLTDEFCPSYDRNSPLYYQLRHFAWPKFIEHIQKNFAGSISNFGKNHQQELKLSDLFAPDTPAIVRIGEHEFQVTGSIDAVERTSGHLIITDYKSKGLPAAQEVKSGQIPQLMIYAVTLGQQNKDLGSSLEMIAGYYSILSGKWESRLCTDRTPFGNMKLAKVQLLDELVENFLELFNWRQQELKNNNGELILDSSTCGYCPYDLICRKEDLALADSQRAQPLLKEYLR